MTLFICQVYTVVTFDYEPALLLIIVLFSVVFITSYFIIIMLFITYSYYCCPWYLVVFVKSMWSIYLIYSMYKKVSNT